MVCREILKGFQRKGAKSAKAQRAQRNCKEGLVFSSPRCRPGSSALNRLDSALRRNDGLLVEWRVPERGMHCLHFLRLTAARSIRIPLRPLRLCVFALDVQIFQGAGA